MAATLADDVFKCNFVNEYGLILIKKFTLICSSGSH